MAEDANKAQASGASATRRSHSPQRLRAPWIVRFVGGVMGLIVLTLVVMATVAAGGYFAVIHHIRRHDVEVPNLTGRPAADSLRSLGEVGLSLIYDDGVYHDTIPAGCIIRQTPRAGRRAKFGTPVRVVMSLGPQITTTPDVTGQTEQEAASALQNEGITVGAITRYPSATIRPGVVLTQSPQPGEGLRRDKPVNLLISSGAPTAL